jgi:asparagine synthase (glutamine-hydrolysing)
LVTLDGAIYNRSDVSDRPTDLDAIGDLYRRLGFAEMLACINGDFALSVFDPAHGECWVARDRFGIKPLYYISNRDRFAFASRLRSLMTLPEVTLAPRPRFVACFAGSHYRTFDNEPTESPYVDISQLPAAHYLRASGDGVSIHRYWQLNDTGDAEASEQELAERYRELLSNAVAVRLKGARRPAFTLSGGMDSSSVLASAVAITKEKQHSFSTVYEDPTYDERREIQSILGAAVSEWHQVEIACPDLLGVVQRMITANDEPVATATWLSHNEMCEAVANLGFGSLFGGLGGDELNAGEYEYFFYFFADLRIQNANERLQREATKWIEYHDHPIFKKSLQVMEQALARQVDFTQPGRCLPDRVRLDRYANTVNREFFDLFAYEPIMDHPFNSYLKNRTFQDIYRETAPCCLRAADRQAAGAGLEVFWPFFDHRLVELLFRVPGTLKIRDGVTKHLLRSAMRGVLPEETRTRIKKTGWNAPAHIWFTGKMRDVLLDLVGSQRFQQRGIYEVDRVRTLIEEHDNIVTSQRAVDNHMMFLWQLLNLELWLQTLERSPKEVA